MSFCPAVFLMTPLPGISIIGQQDNKTKSKLKIVNRIKLLRVKMRIFTVLLGIGT